jgi:hypothetical protein
MMLFFKSFRQARARATYAACDRSAPRTAVGLDNIAIQKDLAFAEQIRIDHRAQTSADQPLNFLCAT